MELEALSRITGYRGSCDFSIKHDLKSHWDTGKVSVITAMLDQSDVSQICLTADTFGLSQGISKRPGEKLK
jgi:hypothetical protein